MTRTRWPSLTPCVTCPWRRSSTVGGADIPGFDIDMMRALEGCVGEDDGFRTIMACHGSAPGEERPCVGYLFRHGWSNLLVRIHSADGNIPMHELMDACQDLDLWPDFHTMLAAYEAAQ